MKTATLLSRSTAMLALATALASLPYHLSFAPGDGLVGIGKSVAFARNGDDSGGGRGGDDDNGGHGGGSDRSDDSGGHGGGDDDNGGNDRSDDSGGNGNGNGGGNGGGHDDGDDSGGDDNSGRGNDDRGGDDSGGGNTDRDDSSGRGGGDDSGRARAGDDAHEATLSDGSRIEIENGRFELKDASGRTIVERPATAADRALLNGARNADRPANAAAGGSAAGAPPRTGNRGGGLVAEVEVSGENIEIRYTDGWKEEIENGRYQLKDELNRTVIERSVRPSDRERLFAAVQ